MDPKPVSKLYSVAIRLTKPFDDELAALREAEGRILGQWAAEGTLEAAFVRADLSGAFLFIHETDVPRLESRLTTLPMRRWMEVSIAECLPPSDAGRPG